MTVAPYASQLTLQQAYQLGQRAGQVTRVVYDKMKKYYNGRSKSKSRSKKRFSKRKSSSSSRSSRRSKTVSASVGIGVMSHVRGSGSNCTGIYYAARNQKRLRGFWRALMMPRAWRNDDAERLTAADGNQGVTYMPVGAATDYTQCFDILDASGNATTKAYIEGWQGEIRITNQNPGNCEVTIYSLVPRRSMNTASTPVTEFGTGLSDTNGTSTTTKGISNLGVTPYESPQFCSMYKIVKKTVLFMGQGCSHVHKFNFKLNRVFTKDEFSLFNQYKYFTHYFLIVVNGMPYNDENTKTLVATGSCALDIVKIARLRYRGINDQASYYQYTSGQDNVLSQMNMDVGSGAPEVAIDA